MQDGQPAWSSAIIEANDNRLTQEPDHCDILGQPSAVKRSRDIFYMVFVRVWVPNQEL